MKFKTAKELDKLVADCINDMKEPIVELANKYPAEIINGAMLELSLRMILLSSAISLYTLYNAGYFLKLSIFPFFLSFRF